MAFFSFFGIDTCVSKCCTDDRRTEVIDNEIYSVTDYPPVLPEKAAVPVPVKNDSEFGSLFRKTKEDAPKGKNNENQNQNKKAAKGPAKKKLVTKPKEEVAPKPIAKPEPQPAGPFSDGSTLQVLLDNGWSNCADDEVQQVGIQLAAETKKFTVLARGSMYIYDFSDSGSPTQTNPTTKKTRQVRIVKPAMQFD